MAAFGAMRLDGQHHMGNKDMEDGQVTVSGCLAGRPLLWLPGSAEGSALHGVRHEETDTRADDLEPVQLSSDIRGAQDQLTRHRRRVVRLSLTSAACMAVVALYQVGATKHVPEPPLPMLDADAVDASAQAYARLSVGTPSSDSSATA